MKEGMKWQAVLQDLLTVYSQEAIGKELGLHQATISKMALGKLKSIRFEEGLKMLAMHKKLLALKKE